MFGTVKPKCFSANIANAGEMWSDKAFAWYILYTCLTTLDLRHVIPCSLHLLTLNDICHVFAHF